MPRRFIEVDNAVEASVARRIDLAQLDESPVRQTSVRGAVTADREDRGG